jgi:hypothetical protein
MGQNFNHFTCLAPSNRSLISVSISEMKFWNNFSSQIAVLSHYPLPVCLWYSSPLSNNSKISYQSCCNTVHLPLKPQHNWRCECAQKPSVCTCKKMNHWQKSYFCKIRYSTYLWFFLNLIFAGNQNCKHCREISHSTINIKPVLTNINTYIYPSQILRTSLQLQYFNRTERSISN